MGNEKRRDNKNRVLRTGESQKKDGRYVYKYTNVDGQVKFLYSWKLEPHDKIPAGKQNDLSLREKIKQVRRDLEDSINPDRGNMTVLALIEKYTSLKVNLKKSTAANYKSFLNLMRNDPIVSKLGSKRIKNVKASDLKLWCVELQQNGRRFNTIRNFKHIVSPAFEMAIEDNIIRKNPFKFNLSKIIKEDAQERIALTEKQMNDLLKYCKNSGRYAQYYPGLYILFHTGLRISEFAGLTFSDIDLEEHTIDVNHQLNRADDSNQFYIESPKSKAGYRIIPMSEEVVECFKKAIEYRPKVKKEVMVDGYVGFIFLTEKKVPTGEFVWRARINSLVNAYNKEHAIQMPHITPHICRHSFCTHMANAGMNPKALQYIMGHENISVTLNVYTHTDVNMVKQELSNILDLPKAQ